MSGYVQVRIKSGKNIGGQVSHDTRRRKPAYVKAESEVVVLLYKADAEDNDENEIYNIKGDNDPNINQIQKHIKEEMQKRIATQQKAYKQMHKRAMPKTANHFFKGIITFSHENTVGEKTNNMDRSLLDRQANKFLEIMFEEYGVDSLYLARHEDETTVHYHFVCENFNYEKARTVQRALESEEFSKMQDLVGEAFVLDRFQRGEPKYKTGANHVKFQKWEREQIAKANVDVKETAQIVQKTKTDIVALKESAKEDENELLEIIKRIVEKERELEEKKALVIKAKEARKAFVESWKGNSKNADLEKLRTYEEQTQKYRGELKIVRSELKELKVKRDELLGGVESKEMDIAELIDDVDEKIEDVEKKVRTQKNK
jgi:hypothetical protein